MVSASDEWEQDSASRSKLALKCLRNLLGSCFRHEHLRPRYYWWSKSDRCFSICCITRTGLSSTHRCAESRCTCINTLKWSREDDVVASWWAGPSCCRRNERALSLIALQSFNIPENRKGVNSMTATARSLYDAKCVRSPTELPFFGWKRTLIHGIQFHAKDDLRKYGEQL